MVTSRVNVTYTFHEVAGSNPVSRTNNLTLLSIKLTIKLRRNAHMVAESGYTLLKIYQTTKFLLNLIELLLNFN